MTAQKQARQPPLRAASDRESPDTGDKLAAATPTRGRAALVMRSIEALVGFALLAGGLRYLSRYVAWYWLVAGVFVIALVFVLLIAELRIRSENSRLLTRFIRYRRPLECFGIRAERAAASGAARGCTPPAVTSSRMPRSEQRRDRSDHPSDRTDSR